MIISKFLPAYCYKICYCKLTKILPFVVVMLSVSLAWPSEIQTNIDARYKDLLRQREIESRAKFIKEEPLALPAEAPKPSQNVSGRIRHFSKIDVIFNKISRISQSDINKIIKPYINAPAGIKEISVIQKQLQELYLKKGYASARIYINGNTMRDNVLTFVIHEGYIEDVIFKNPDGTRYGKTANAMQKFSFYPFAEGALLNIRDLDQGLEQINKLSSNNAVLAVLPGSKDGYSVIEVANNPSKRFKFSLGADNGGNRNSGVYKADSSLNSENLLMLNDNIYFNYSRNIDGNEDDKENNACFASFRLPFGYFTFMASYFNSDYSAPAGVSYGNYTSDGSTKNMNSSIETVIKRSQNYKISAGAELALKETVNSVAGQIVDASSRKLSVASGFLTATSYTKTAVIYSKLSYSRGLDAFDAVRNSGIRYSPQGQFYSVSFYTQYAQAFKIPLANLLSSYSMAVNAQYTPGVLYSSEQISIGGESSVRGFKEGNVSGESGGYIKNDINWALSDIFGREGFRKILKSASLNVFADYGYVRHESYSRDYQLAGVGAGFSYGIKHFNASCIWSRAIYNESPLEDEKDVFYLKAEGSVYF